MIIKGHALDLIEALDEKPDLIVTDPPYAFGGTGPEHAISATVATVLRESARKLKRDSWMLVMCAASYRSHAYMVESVRGIVEPVRVATWCKPKDEDKKAKTKVQTSGWQFSSVSVIAFRKGRAQAPSSFLPDYIVAEAVKGGRRAELPIEVCRWMVSPYALLGGLCLDPFAGSGKILDAAAEFGMRTLGYELNPLEQKVAA